VADLLPPNSTPLEQSLAESISRLSVVAIASVSDLWNPDTCPLDILPWLAWAEGIGEWSSLWSVPVQRAVIKAHRSVRRTRGTKQAVVDAIESFGGSIAITEWFEKIPQGTPHTFDITITGGDGYIEAGLQESMIRAIDNVKPARSHYTLGVGLTASGQFNMAGVSMVSTYKRLEFTD